MTIISAPCVFKKEGPYGVKILTEIKPSDQSIELEDYNSNRQIYINGYLKNISLKYSVEAKNIVIDSLTEYGTKEENTNNIDLVRQFFNDYFFLTNEKLTQFFPPEQVKASLLSRTLILLKLYQSIEHDDKSYYYSFKYSYRDGFLFLTSYNGDIPFNGPSLKF